MSLLNRFETELRKVYEDGLLTTLADHWEPTSASPVWVTVSNSDFLTLSDAEYDSAGLLLDPGLGKALVVCIYEGDDLNDSIQRAIKVASSFQPVYQQQNAEKAEPWHVDILWLVQNSSEEKWRASIAIRREESGFSEEVGLDALFFEDESTLAEQIEKHGLPRLLIKTRSMAKADRINIKRWTSANEDVLEALHSFADFFQDADTKVFAQDVVRAASEKYLDSEGSQLPEVPHNIHQLKVNNFRNISKVSLDFDSALSGTEKNAHLVFGPNGTGKSSLFEAISLAVSGVSTKSSLWLNKSEEKDILPSQRSQYLESVITPIDGGTSETHYSVNSEFREPCETLPDAISRLKEIDGVLLSQETSRRFIETSGAELGAQVLQGYSTAASQAYSHAEKRYQESKSAKDDFLRNLGINTAIKVVNSAHEKMAEKVYDDLFPKVSGLISQWLLFVKNLHLEDAEKLRQGIEHLERESKKGVLIAFMSISDDVETSKKNIEPWLLNYESNAKSIAEYIQRARIDYLPTLEQWENIKKDILLWAEWLRKSQSSIQNEGIETVEVVSLNERYAVLAMKAQAISIQGRELGDRLSHFKSIGIFLNSWVEKHPNECPTCSADHQEHGGIKEVVTKQEKDITIEQERLREEWKETNKQMKSIEIKRSVLTGSKSPISKARQDELNSCLKLFLRGSNIEEVIRIGQESEVLAQISRVINVPDKLPETIQNVEHLISLIIERVRSDEIRRAEVWDAPTKWEEVRKKLRSITFEVVQKHMPNTLQAVWMEIGMAITSAPWNTKKPKFKSELKRGDEKLTIVIEGNREMLGRYFYNQAEGHVLGLAWFFTRYLAEGRFRFEWQAMDDPAQEMDQTTFRAFCRFMQSWLRINNGSNSGGTYKLICFLHQEDRALDMARSLWGETHMLKWTEKNSGQLSILKLFGEEFSPGVPIISTEVHSG